MDFRLAGIDDAGPLARAHMISGARQPAGFMFRLGERFLKEYYRSILMTKGTVILCAEKDGAIAGFISGSLCAEERLPGLRRRRIQIALAAVPAFIRHPSLIREAYDRLVSGSAESGTGYIILSGAHQEYWGWCMKGSSGSLLLQRKWLEIMKTLGAKIIRCEVDGVNPLSENAHKFCGARRVDQLVTPDGRDRHILAYEL